MLSYRLEYNNANSPVRNPVSHIFMLISLFCLMVWLAADFVTDVADGFGWVKAISRCHCEAAGKRVNLLILALKQPKQSHKTICLEIASANFMPFP